MVLIDNGFRDLAVYPSEGGEEEEKTGQDRADRSSGKSAGTYFVGQAGNFIQIHAGLECVPL